MRWPYGGASPVPWASVGKRWAARGAPATLPGRVYLPELRIYKPRHVQSAAPAAAAPRAPAARLTGYPIQGRIYRPEEDKRIEAFRLGWVPGYQCIQFVPVDHT